MSDQTQPPEVQKLQQNADGLLFPSETDAPLEPLFWPQESPPKLTTDALIERIGVTNDTPVKTVKLERFFRYATTREEWHNAEEQAEVERFRNLVKTIKGTLKDVQVFRVGETNIDVYIVGIVESGYAGLKTKVVET